MIPLSSFAGGTLDINSLAGDDLITIGTLTLLTNQNLELDGGAGSDTATVTGAISTNGGDVLIGVSSGVTLSGANADVTTGGGVVTIDADSDSDGTGTFSSDNAGSSIVTGNGDVSITAADVELVRNHSMQVHRQRPAGNVESWSDDRSGSDGWHRASSL